MCEGMCCDVRTCARPAPQGVALPDMGALCTRLLTLLQGLCAAAMAQRTTCHSMRSRRPATPGTHHGEARLVDNQLIEALHATSQQLNTIALLIEAAHSSRRSEEKKQGNGQHVSAGPCGAPPHAGGQELDSNVKCYIFLLYSVMQYKLLATAPCAGEYPTIELSFKLQGVWPEWALGMDGSHTAIECF